MVAQQVEIILPEAVSSENGTISNIHKVFDWNNDIIYTDEYLSIKNVECWKYSFFLKMP